MMAGWMVPPWLVGIAILLLSLAAALFGERLRSRREAALGAGEENQEGYVVSGIVGLLALLLGFTFSLAVDRFETRRVLVVDEANAIRSAYLQAQTFEGPARDRLTTLIAAYADNRLQLGLTRQGSDEIAGRLARSQQILRQLWATSLAAVAPQRDDVSAAFLDTVREVASLGAARRAAREARVPLRVFQLLLAYMLAASCTLGYVMGPKRRPILFALLALTTLSYVLILDIDGATGGGISESQQPMQELMAQLAAREG